MKNFFTLLVVLGIGIAPTQAQNATTVAQAIHYTKLANTLREVEKSPESINLLNRAMPAFISAKSLYWQAVANELIGLSYKDIRDTTNAINYLKKALDQYSQLKYVASGWGVNEVMRALASKNVYAGIQFGSSGVRVAIFNTTYETDFYGKNIRTTFEIPSNLLTADLSNSFKGSQDALKIGLDSIRRYNIPNERTFIVFSSDLGDGLAKTPQGRKTLYQQLERVLPGGGIHIDTTFTPTREAELFTMGTIPRQVWPSTSALNFGATTTMGGYFEREASKRNFTHAERDFRDIVVPIGVNTLVGQIERKKTLGIDAFKREAQTVIPAIADSLLTPQLKKLDAGLQQRRAVGVGGDIALALITYLHPEKVGVTAVPITLDDIETFKKLALTDYKSLTRPDLKSIPNDQMRDQAERDINTVRDQLTEKQLIAGALWLDAVMKAYNSASMGNKRFVFIHNSDLGWVTGKFLETINNEYESTIAKGEFYTR